MSAVSGASVVVVGGGASGLSAGWWLAREGVDVLVVDAGIVGWEASGRNGGGATHYQSPLFHEEQRLWPMMDEMLGYPTEYRRERIIFATNEAHLAEYRHMAETCIGLGYHASFLDGAEVRARVPFAGENALGGVHFHFGGHANPQRTVQAYAWALQDHGGRIRQHVKVTGLTLAGGRVTAVETTAGPIGCDHVVLAAGPGLAAIAATIGIEVPLAPARAEMIVTEALPLMAVGGVDGNGLYGRQTLRGNLAYGGGPHEWLDLPDGRPTGRPSTPVLAGLARRLAELFPKAAHVNVIRSWAGVIENTPDGRPVIERLADPDNLTLCTMSAVGFGLSPATGHALRDLVVDGRCSFADLDKLRLARFAGLSPDWRRQQGWVAAPAARAVPEVV